MALMETTFEELQSLKASQEEMKARVCALEDSREEAEASWQHQKKEMTEQHQKELKDLEQACHWALLAEALLAHLQGRSGLGAAETSAGRRQG